jgi:hypothetical protein
MIGPRFVFGYASARAMLKALRFRMGYYDGYERNCRDI